MSDIWTQLDDDNIDDTEDEQTLAVAAAITKGEEMDREKERAPRKAKAAPAIEEPEDENRKATEYIVMRADGEMGPWSVLGSYKGHGQIAAKRLAAEALEDADKFWFIAIPVSSYNPQQPSVKVTTQITF